MKKTYKYVIELDKPVWPRKIADSVMYHSGKVYNATLLSVKDLQYKKHFYGDTYKVAYEDDPKLMLGFACNKCGESLNMKTMKNTPDGALYCPECFQRLLDEE